MIERLYQHYLAQPVICTDTRKIEKGCIFFALKGPNFDANKFAKEALDKGASLCVIDDASVKEDDRYFLVDDVLTALQDLARHHRSQLTIPIIGLTGSNGKTTSKELITTALRARYQVFATKGNLNNHIGVALSILNIHKEHELAVIEMGANHVGEIAFLCTISRPTHGFITNIGKAHLEGFGGIEGVIRGKSELYHHLIQHDGVVWINSNNDILSNMAKRFREPLFYPNKGDFYHCELLESKPTLNIRAENGDELRTHLVGSYNFENVAVALCIAKYFEVDDTAANKAVAGYEPDNNRSQVVKTASNRVIMDAYNANPTSMANALQNLYDMDAPKKVAILGDMNELGEDSEKEHRSLGKLLQGYAFDQVYLCGRLIAPAKDEYAQAHYFTDRQSLTEYLQQHPIKEATVLCKASRSIGLEKIEQVL